MILKCATAPLSCSVFYYADADKKKRRRLYEIEIPSQSLVYSLDNSAYEDRGVKVRVTIFPDEPVESGKKKAETTTWALGTLGLLVDAVRAVTATALPYLEAHPELTAEAAITEDTHVWCSLEKMEVGGGFLRRGEAQLCQTVTLDLLGLARGLLQHASSKVLWDPEMLAPLVELRDAFESQKLAFIQKVESVRR